MVPNPDPQQLHAELVYHPHPDGRRGSRTFYLEPVDPRPDTEREQRSETQWWLVLLRHPVLLLFFGVFGALCGSVTFLQTPVYRARTTLEFQSLNDSLLNVRIGDFDPAANAGSAGMSQESNAETQMRILSSQSLQRRVAEKLHIKDASASPDWKTAILSLIGIGLAERDHKKSTLPTVEVRMLGPTRIIELQCESPEPKLAATFANTMANEYIESTLESRWNAAQRTTEWLTKQLEELKIKLQKSEDQLQAYSREWGIVFTGRDTADQEKLRKLQEELAKAQSDRATKQSANEVAAASAIEAVPQVIDNGRLGEYEIKIADLRRELAELTAVYSANHYKVKRVQAQIDELQRTLKKERMNILYRINNEYSAAARREVLLSNAYDAQAKRVSEQAAQAVYYNLLKHEVDTNRNIYDALLQRVKEAGIASAVRSTNVRVVDVAETPTSPYKPRPIRNCVLGFLTSLICGALVLVVRERADSSFRGPGDTAMHLDVPELGAIPNADIPKSRRFLRAGTAAGSLHPKSGVDANGLGDPPPQVELISWQNRHSLVAECFRATLASILYSGGNGHRPRVIMVTSSLPHEGKTTASCNLAIALGEIDCRTLLIDADLRHPKLHKVFNIPNSSGLSDLLREKTSFEDMPVESLVRKTGIPGLSVLPSGPGTVSVWHLLHSPRMQALLRVFRSEFDAVLIDSPPVLQCTDARVLARYSDGVIVVLRAGQTTKEAALASCRRFAEDRIQVLGTILNRWEPNATTTNYYGTYDGSSQETTTS